MGPKGMRGPIAQTALLVSCGASFARKCCQVGAALAHLWGRVRRVGQRGEVDLKRHGRGRGSSGNKCSGGEREEDTGHNLFPSLEFLFVKIN